MNIDLNKVYNEDCLEFMKKLPDSSVDSIVTDPPSATSFMGQEWDNDKGGKKQWIAWLQSIMKECLRVLKPGGHGLIWSLPRTSHWTATAVEDAGFEIRDCVYHCFFTGFPKSMDISKKIDEYYGLDRKVVGQSKLWGHNAGTGAGSFSKNAYEGVTGSVKYIDVSEPSHELAKKYDDFKTALKPAIECWWLVRKPISEKTIVENVIKHGTGGLNIGDCRIGTSSDNGNTGRYPSHLILDGSDEVSDMFPNSKAGQETDERGNGGMWSGISNKPCGPQYGDDGSAARFFFCAKASTLDRNEFNPFYILDNDVDDEILLDIQKILEGV